MKKTRQSPLVAPSIQHRCDEIQVDTSLRLLMKGKTLKFWLSLYTSKALHEPEDIEDEDLIFLSHCLSKFLYEMQLGLQNNLNKWETMSLDIMERSLKSQQAFKDYMKNRSMTSFNIFCWTANAYFGIKIALDPKKLPELKMSRRPKKYHHVKHVGVGYNDKGSSRLPSEDGVPSWQEVAGSIDEHIAFKLSATKVNVTKNTQNPGFKVIKLKNGVLGDETKFHLEKVQVEHHSLYEEGWVLDSSPQIAMAGFSTRDRLTSSEVLRITESLGAVPSLTQSGKFAFLIAKKQ